MSRQFIINIRVSTKEKEAWLKLAKRKGFTGIGPMVRWLISTETANAAPLKKG